MATFSRIKVWVSNEVLTAAALNAEFDNIITNMTPSGIEDASANVAAMQSSTDPGGVGTESLATSLLGEIQRLRYAVKRIVGGAQWYTAPVIDLGSTIGTADIADSAVTTAKIADANVTTAKLADGNVTKAKLSAANFVVSTPLGAGGVTLSTTASLTQEITEFAVTLTTTGRPVLVKLETSSGVGNSLSPETSYISVYSSTGVSGTKNTGAASAGTAHTHTVDKAEFLATGGYIEIRRETTVAAVTAYRTVFQASLGISSASLNSVGHLQEIPVSSVCFLDTDFSETVGSVMKYKVYATLTSHDILGITKNLSISEKTILKAVEL